MYKWLMLGGNAKEFAMATLQDFVAFKASGLLDNPTQGISKRETPSYSTGQGMGKGQANVSNALRIAE